MVTRPSKNPRAALDRPLHHPLHPEPLRQEFTALYMEWWPIVWSAARKQLFCDADADGAAQDVFLRLWTKGPRAWTVSYPRSFFRTAGRNEALMILRRRERQSPLRDQFAAILPSSELTPDELAARSEAVQLIEAAIAQLPARCARVISLVLSDDLTNDEIAKHLGIRTGAVEKQRARARRILQRLLPPFLPW